MAYLIISDDLVVFTCSDIRFFIFDVFLLSKLPVHILMCWTNETTLAVQIPNNNVLMQKKKRKRKGDIVIISKCIVYMFDIVPCRSWTKLKIWRCIIVFFF